MSVVTLTSRERELIVLVSEGLSNKNIARRLNLSEGTIKIYLHKMYEKVGVRNRAALVAFAMRAPLGKFLRVCLKGAASDSPPIGRVATHKS
jgi:DNA-binding NarL/FixJ family response regulator